MVAVYVLLDGFDLGAGAIHLLVAKTDEERRQVLASIGPVWDGNEVWLIAAGGTMYFVLPPPLSPGFCRFFFPAADDCFVASDSSGSVDRIPESHQKRSVGSTVGFSFLRIESATGRVLWSGAGQRGARRPAGRQRLFFRAAVGH